jgi:hypothetical protein
LHPSDALSPKWRIDPGSIKVIFTNDDWAVATMIYDGREATGIRWNGDITNRNDLGYPSARGSNGAWFILPEPVGAMTLSMITLAQDIK